MFSGAVAFQQPLVSWNLSNTATYKMFDDSYKHQKKDSATKINNIKHYYKR